MPTPDNAPYKILQRRSRIRTVTNIGDALGVWRRKPGPVRVGRKGAYELDDRGCIVNVVAERRIRKKLGLSPRQFRKQKRAARAHARRMGWSELE